MPVQYHETFEIITEDSAAYGEAAYCGSILENGEADFADLCNMLEGTEPSCSPLPAEPHADIWFTRYGEMDVDSGEYENRSLHAADQRAARYMVKAWNYTNA